jgi:hypothetical protein
MAKSRLQWKRTANSARPSDVKNVASSRRLSMKLSHWGALGDRQGAALGPDAGRLSAVCERQQAVGTSAAIVVGSAGRGTVMPIEGGLSAARRLARLVGATGAKPSEQLDKARA